MSATKLAPTPLEKYAARTSLDGPEQGVAQQHLLDTSIETGYSILGLTEDGNSTDILLDHIKEVPTADHQFDFLHIRYRPSGLAPALLSAAYQKIKPGGWLEVVATEHAFSQVPRNSLTKQLREAGFIEVEEKAGPKERRFGVKHIFGSLTRSFSGMFRSNSAAAGGRSSKMSEAGDVDTSGISVFVIAKKPL